MVGMKTVFAIGCHPDDIEFVMSGTLMRLQAAGCELHYMNLANGCCGTASLDPEAIVRIRRQEAREAAAMIGAVYHEALLNDLEVYYEPVALRTLMAVVRDVQPDIVLTHYPFEYMEDHSNTCRLAVSATFCRGIRNVTTQPERPPVQKPVTLYHAMPFGLRDPLRRKVQADLYVDVYDLLDRKQAMLACHKSQKAWLDVSQGMDAYLQAMADMCREAGRDSGFYEAAEGWIRHLHLGFCAPGDDPLTEILGPHVSASKANAAL